MNINIQRKKNIYSNEIYVYKYIICSNRKGRKF